MIFKIINMQIIRDYKPVFVENKHFSYITNGKKIYLFKVIFDNNAEGKCGQLAPEPKYAKGDKVNYNIISQVEGKLPYLRIIPKSTFSKDTINKPVLKDNSSIAIAAVTIAADAILRADKKLISTDKDRAKLGIAAIVIAKIIVETTAKIENL